MGISIIRVPLDLLLKKVKKKVRVNPKKKKYLQTVASAAARATERRSPDSAPLKKETKKKKLRNGWERAINCACWLSQIWCGLELDCKLL